MLFPFPEPDFSNEIFGLYAHSAKEMPGGFQRRAALSFSAPGHPIGASSSLLAWGSIGEQRSTWHTILLAKSSVLYLL